MSYCGNSLYKAGVSRERMTRLAAALDDSWLRDLATSHVRWDRITRIEPAGEIEVCEINMPHADALIADDVLVCAP